MAGAAQWLGRSDFGEDERVGRDFGEDERVGAVVGSTRPNSAAAL